MPRNKRFAFFFTCLVILCGSILPSATCSAAEDEFRTWTATTGSKIKAKFVSIDDGNVTLVKEDGNEIEIPLNKLSEADRKFATEAADNPFKPKADSPFKANGSAKKSAPAKTDDDEPPASEAKTIAVDLSQTEQIALSAPSDKWQMTPPGAGEPIYSGKPKVVSLPKKSGFFEGLKGLAINPIATVAAVGFVVADPRPTGVSRVVLCDLATGKCSAPATTPGQMVPIAVHDDGKQIVMRREEFGFGNQDRLEVWRLKGDKPVKSLVWTPYGSDQGGPRDVMWAEFIDETHLATSSRAGKVVIWKYPQLKPEAMFTMVDGAVPALSSDRTQIAWCNGDQVGVIDLKTREVIAQQATPSKLQWPYMAYSPSGKRLACIAFDKLLVWDTATGKLERNIPAAGLNIHGAIDFPDDDYVLAGGKYVIDIENQIKLWTYDGQEQVKSVGGWTFFGITDGDKNPGVLAPSQVPHQAAKDLLKKALTDPNLFVLKSGTKVKLNGSGVSDAAQRGAVLESLTKRLQTIGCQADPNGTIELAATVEGPKDRDIRYHGSGDYKVKEWTSRVRFVYQGQPVWEATGTNVPGFMMLKEGENIGEKLKQSEKPDYGFFSRVEFPKFLQKPSAGQAAGRSLTLGTSRMTTSGMK